MNITAKIRYARRGRQVGGKVGRREEAAFSTLESIFLAFEVIVVIAFSCE